MPRNRYTKTVREHQQANKERREKELAAAAANFRCQNEESFEVSPVNKAKELRSVRIEQKRRRNAKRWSGVTGADRKS